MGALPQQELGIVLELGYPKLSYFIQSMDSAESEPRTGRQKPFNESVLSKAVAIGENLKPDLDWSR